MILLIIEIIFAFSLILNSKTFGCNKLDSKTIRIIKEQGLYHVTTKHEQIMHNGIAHLLPSKRLQSYSNWFRPTVFFFAGKPSKVASSFNLRKEEQKALTAIWIKPEDITDDFLSKLRFRKLDNAVMFSGELFHKAEVVKIDVEGNFMEFLKFQTKFVLTVFGLFGLSTVISTFLSIILKLTLFIA